MFVIQKELLQSYCNKETDCGSAHSLNKSALQ